MKTKSWHQVITFWEHLQVFEHITDEKQRPSQILTNRWQLSLENKYPRKLKKLSKKIKNIWKTNAMAFQFA